MVVIPVSSWIFYGIEVYWSRNHGTVFYGVPFPSGAALLYVSEIIMKRKIKNFFTTLWGYICLPFLWLSTRKIDKKLTQVAEEDRAALLTEQDVEFLRSIGVETTLEELQDKCKKH